MELNIGDKVTIRYYGDIRRIVSIGKVTAKRAYASPSKNIEGEWDYEFKREQDGPEWLKMIGLQDYSRISASMTTQKHLDEMAHIRSVRLAKKFFDELLNDETRMLEAYRKLTEAV